MRLEGGGDESSYLIRRGRAAPACVRSLSLLGHCFELREVHCSRPNLDPLPCKPDGIRMAITQEDLHQAARPWFMEEATTERCRLCAPHPGREPA